MGLKMFFLEIGNALALCSPGAAVMNKCISRVELQTL